MQSGLVGHRNQRSFYPHSRFANLGTIHQVRQVEAEGPVNERSDVAGQRPALENPRLRRARIRPPEGTDETLRTIGIARAKTRIGMTNLAYNLDTWGNRGSEPFEDLLTPWRVAVPR